MDRELVKQVINYIKRLALDPEVVNPEGWEELRYYIGHGGYPDDVVDGFYGLYGGTLNEIVKALDHLLDLIDEKKING